MTPPPLPRAKIAAAPSWKVPIAVGAVLTLMLHGPVLNENLLWVALCASFGITGMFCGIVPAWLALRRDPAPTMGNGFAVAFISVGVGAVALAMATLWRGFSIPPEQAEFWRTEFLRHEVDAAAVDELLARLRGGEGGSWAVMGATFLAFGGGLAGAVVAAVRTRRTRRAAAR